MYWEYEEEILLIDLFNYSKHHNKDDVEKAIKELSVLLVARANHIETNNGPRSTETIKIKLQQIGRKTILSPIDEHDTTSWLYYRSINNPDEFSDEVALIKEKFSNLIHLTIDEPTTEVKDTTITQKKNHCKDENSYSDIYRLNSKDYCSINLEDIQLSNRTYNALKRSNVNTVGDLLNLTPTDLRAIKNFGINCVNDVENFISSITDKAQSLKLLYPSLIKKREKLAAGDFSVFDVLELTSEEQDKIYRYKKAFEMLGDELTQNCFKKPQYIMLIANVMKAYYNRTETRKLKSQNLIDAFNRLPEDRSNKIAYHYLIAYPVKDYIKQPLLKLCSNHETSIRDLVYQFEFDDRVVDKLSNF